MEMKNFQSLLFAFLFLSIASCNSISRESPEKRYYWIEISEKSLAEIQSSSKRPNIRLKRLTISPRYENKEFTYRRSDVLFETDFYNLFFLTPANNLREEVTKALVRSGFLPLEDYVGQRNEENYSWEVNVSELYGDFRTGKGKAVIAWEWIVTREGGTLARGMEKVEVPLTSSAPEALVEGWNQALWQIFRQTSQKWEGIR